MLLVRRTHTAILRAAPFHRCVVNLRHFRFLDEDFAAPAIVIHVVRDQHPLGAMLRAALQKENVVVLENALSFQLSEADGANRYSHVVKHVRTYARTHRDGLRYKLLSRVIKPQSSPKTNASTHAIKMTENMTDKVLPPEIIAPKHDPAPSTIAASSVSPIGRQLILLGETC